MEVITDKNIRIVDSIFDPNSRDQNVVNYYKGSDNRVRYKVWIFLEGRDSYYVDSVIYRLHCTFSDPVRKVKRSIANPNCCLVIWTWGVFELTTEIILKTDEKIHASHQMSYNEQLLKRDLKFVEARGGDIWKFI